MDKLSLERFEEHEPHGWRILMDIYMISNTKKIDGFWMECSCGWVGWVVNDPERQPVESVDRR